MGFFAVRTISPKSVDSSLRRIQQASHIRDGHATHRLLDYAAQSYCELNDYTRDRLVRHLLRRSQRGHANPAERRWWDYLLLLGWKPIERILTHAPLCPVSTGAIRNCAMAP